MPDFKLDSIEPSTSGLDAFFEREPQVIAPFGAQAKQAASKPQRIKIGSLQQLQGFVRSGSDTLVHKSTNDLWALRQEGENYYIERLFNDTGNPLKG